MPCSKLFRVRLDKGYCVLWVDGRGAGGDCRVLKEKVLERGGWERGLCASSRAEYATKHFVAYVAIGGTRLQPCLFLEARDIWGPAWCGRCRKSGVNAPIRVLDLDLFGVRHNIWPERAHAAFHVLGRRISLGSGGYLWYPSITLDTATTTLLSRT